MYTLQGESLSTQTLLPWKEAQGPEDSLEALLWAPSLGPLDLTPCGRGGSQASGAPFLYVLSEIVSPDF